MQETMTETTFITVDVIRHDETGMFLAVSDEMKGLYVHARSQRELNERIPIAIKDILEAEGKRVSEVNAIDDPSLDDTGFQGSKKKFRLSEAA